LVEAFNRYLPLRCVFKFQLVKLAKGELAAKGGDLSTGETVFAKIETLFTPNETVIAPILTIIAPTYY
jgi:hypothetical protein